MSTFSLEVIHKPIIKLTRMTMWEMDTLLRSKLNWKKLKLTDSYYFHPSFDDLDKMIQHLMKSLPRYVPDKFDCENFAGYLKVMAAKEFGCNIFGNAEGWADFQDGHGPQRHGWTILTDGIDLFQIESQKSRGYIFMDIDDPYYIPDELVIG